MARYYGIATDIGNAAIANAMIKGDTVGAVAFVVGDGGGGYYEPAPDMSALRREVWRGPISDMSVDPASPMTVNFSAVLPSDIGGFVVREIGIIDERGYLLGVGNVPDTQIVAFGDGVTDETMFTLSFVVTNPEALTWIADPTVITATRDWVKRYFSEQQSSTSFGSVVPNEKANTLVINHGFAVVADGVLVLA
jgi:phage-related tail fiber protein